MKIETYEVYKNVLTVPDGFRFKTKIVSNISLFYNSDMVFSQDDTKLTWYNEAHDPHFNYNELKLLEALIKEANGLESIEN